MREVVRLKLLGIDINGLALLREIITQKTQARRVRRLSIGVSQYEYAWFHACLV